VIVASGQRVADTGKDILTELVGAGGLEQPSKGQQKRESVPGRRKMRRISDPADLADLTARLAALPENVRQALAAALAAK
jgi:thioredoxin-like negative regulator of GroEL